jgi:hypothetical protein
LIHTLALYGVVLAATWTWIFILCAFALRFRADYAALFAAIQTIGGVPWSPLFVIGFFLVAILSYFYAWLLIDGKFQWRGGLLTFLWSNEENGIVAPGVSLNRKNAFYWSAIRNSVNNLRYVWGVSKAGRPLWYWTKEGMRVRTLNLFGHTLTTPSQIYAKVGWMSDGYPAFSAGAGRGY